VSRVCSRVRTAGLGDVPALVELIGAVDVTTGTFSGRALLDPSDDHLTERLTEILREDSRTLLIAVDDSTERIVGLLVAKRDEIGAIDLTPVLHVSHLMVAPKSRRRGIGRTLLTAAVHLAEELGIEHVLASASSGSREANRYLARIGFAPMVVHRVAPTAELRRSLGMVDAPERIAVLRRARLARAARVGPGVRVARRGA
jgi:ribosomal protein S18 acetylase RimI-like enzyme